jgi:hypothetical protein
MLLHMLLQITAVVVLPSPWLCCCVCCPCLLQPRPARSAACCLADQLLLQPCKNNTLMQKRGKEQMVRHLC